MADDNSIIYGLEFQARALAPQLAETEAVRFFVGTQSLKFTQNQIHLVELDEEHSYVNTRVFPHSTGEIWSVSPSPVSADVISTCYNTITDNSCVMKSALWRLPPAETEDQTDVDQEGGSGSHHSSMNPLECLCELDTMQHGKEVKVSVFHPTDGSRVMSVVDNHFLLFDVGESSPKLISKGTLEGKGQPRFMTGKWNSHHKCTQFVTASECSIRSWDLREDNKQAWCIDGAHSQLVRDFDINPNKQYYIASGGDDGSTKFWDVRNPSEPVISISDHSHWVWAVRYNHFHDQLVLTSSSDARLVLTSVASISSEPDGHLGAPEDEVDSKNGRLADGILATYDQHEDSVYSVEWSVADPWTFASLSYDGRLVINKVPKAVKYKILL
ncbi:EARP-interacting protein homolog isoform X2 [Thrips palmi]|uniref:EARP-interacting protein homolog isoform X2 n=1 Tax=Thrips palmi TaxID=161013 RepID=A0A6P8YT02_THRPL|nr:EARP-interacting protein homolog isoform X2 [Thrips palmi]